MINYIKNQIQASIDTKQNILNDEELMQTIAEVGQACVELYQNGKKTLLAGNGGSAADAQHIAAELVGRFENNRQPLPALALTTDSSVVTSIANDFGFEYIFSKQLEALAKNNDILIALPILGLK